MIASVLTFYPRYVCQDVMLYAVLIQCASVCLYGVQFLSEKTSIFHSSCSIANIVSVVVVIEVYGQR